MKCVIVAIVIFAFIAWIGWIVWELTHPMDEHEEAIDWRNRKKPN